MLIGELSKTLPSQYSSPREVREEKNVNDDVQRSREIAIGKEQELANSAVVERLKKSEYSELIKKDKENTQNEENILKRRGNVDIFV